jgi:ABC-type phosphate/phosphonate transport system substrate-binding protein
MLKRLGFPGFIAPKPAEYAMMRNYDPSSRITNAASAHTGELVLGVFPFLGSRQIAQNFAPVLPALGKAAGAPVYLRTASNFDNFGIAIAAANYDIAIVQPFDYARAVEHGYQPLAGMKNSLQGTFFVLDKSPYQQISDFRGQVVAMPPPEAAQSRLGRHALMQAGLKPGRDVTINYRNTHDSCIQEVQRGAAAACVTADITLQMLPKELSRSLRMVGQTEKVPGVLIMAHERLPATMREKLQAEIIAWKDSDEGRKILQSVGFGDFVTIKAADYRHLPRLD